MAHKPADRIRNVALIGHRGSGKTSLAEALLFEAGVVNRLGRVTDGSTVFDFEPDEQEREMSIGAGVASFEYDGRKINLIDTPGDSSFIADTLGALRVVDAAVVVINAVMGVEVHTERLWGRAAEEGLARLVFVNMLDRERADFFRTLESLKGAFGPHAVATEIPIGSEHEVRGVIDLIDMTAFEYEGEGRGSSREIEIPEDLRAQAEEYREKLMDEVAENSDELMERYLEGEEISHEEIVTALKKGVTQGQLFPVTCGVATKNLGTNRLLEALVEDVPSPAMRGAVGLSTATATRSRSSHRRTPSRSPTSSRPPPIPTRGESTCCGSTQASCAPTRTSSTSPAAPRSGSASSRCHAARRPIRWTSSDPVTLARSPSSARPEPGMCWRPRMPRSRSRPSTCRRR